MTPLSPLLRRGALLAACCACSASAATLVQYGLNNTYAASNAAGISGSSLSVANTITTATFDTSALTAGSFEGTHWVSVTGADLTNAGSGSPGTTPAFPLASNITTDYFEFTLTPDSGSTYDVTALKVIAIGSSSTSATTSLNLTAFITIDYMKAGDAGFTRVGTASSDDNTTAANTKFGRELTFDLSSQPLSDLSVVTTFRVYINDLSGGGTGTLGLDNIRIEGAVSAIPEPSTAAAMLGAAALGFAASRRRRSA